MLKQPSPIVKRIIFASVMVVAAGLLILISHGIHQESNYFLDNTPIANLATENDIIQLPLDGVDEPLDLTRIVQITLGGNCTPGAALGTNSFGSFNLIAEENGRETFLSELNHIFENDHCTVLGCAAVLTDKEYPLDGNLEDLPLIGSSKNAEVFSKGSVDALSLSHKRTGFLGEGGIMDTKTALENEKLGWFDEENLFTKEIYGIKIGILGFEIPLEADTTTYIEKIQTAAASYDYLILYAEREDTEDDYYTLLAQSFIDAGCDLVCFTGGGHQTTATAFNNGIIVDSLGYLIDGSTYNGENTALYSISLHVGEGTIKQVEGTLIPVVFNENPWIPVIE